MIQLNPVFQPIFSTDKRYIVITGGRGSSKSFSTNTAACLLSYEPGHLFLHTRYTMTTAELSIIPEFREKIDLLEANSDFLVLKDKITNKQSGSTIVFRGIKTASGDQTGSLKSIQGLTDWFLDEADELTDEDKFDTIDLSVRGNSAQNRIVLILNPTTKEHWIWKRWFENHLSYVEIDGFKIPVSNHPDILHIHTTFWDNLENLPKDYVSSLLKIRKENPDKYRHKILGGWLEKAEGVVFEEWEEGAFNKFLPYVFGLDFGYFPDPLAMVQVAVDRRKKEIFSKEVLYESKLSTEQAIKAVRNSIAKPHDLIMCDTSEGRLFMELKRSGLNVHKVSKKMTGRDGSIITDIRDMQDYKLIIDPYSYNQKRELNSYVWNDKKASVPIDDNNHTIDPLRYAFRRIVGHKKDRGVRQLN